MRKFFIVIIGCLGIAGALALGNWEDSPPPRGLAVSPDSGGEARPVLASAPDLAEATVVASDDLETHVALLAGRGLSGAELDWLMEERAGSADESSERVSSRAVAAARRSDALTAAWRTGGRRAVLLTLGGPDRSPVPGWVAGDGPEEVTRPGTPDREQVVSPGDNGLVELSDDSSVVLSVGAGAHRLAIGGGPRQLPSEIVFEGVGVSRSLLEVAVRSDSRSPPVLLVFRNLTAFVPNPFHAPSTPMAIRFENCTVGLGQPALLKSETALVYAVATRFEPWQGVHGTSPLLIADTVESVARFVNCDVRGLTPFGLAARSTTRFERCSLSGMSPLWPRHRADVRGACFLSECVESVAADDDEREARFPPVHLRSVRSSFQ